MADLKRGAGADGASGAVVKRQRTDGDGAAKSTTELILSGKSAAEVSGALTKTIKRTSALQAPIMLLTGHAGEVFTTKFSPDGQHIASGSFDQQIFLWNTYGDCTNYNVLKGHKGPVLEVRWSRDGNNIFSASTDHTVAHWDARTGERIRRFRSHTGIVNTISTTRRGPELLASGSDDRSVAIYDPRASKHAIEVLEAPYQVTAVEWSEDGSTVFSSGIDNVIRAWDLRRKAPAYLLQGHADTVTGLRLSPDGSFLLSNAMDNTVRIWDVKPFAPASRLVRTLEGAPQGFEKNLIRPCWSPEGGDFVATGSADRSVTVWEVATGKIVYKLPGHKGVVNEVDWSTKEPIIVSCSSDKTLFLGEVDPEEVVKRR
ncbi:WD40-repeat-containing domain protein [Hyaloraphidium curvatum]|nr:WD40-repeat-containing domain protein [Hyaloraphidium curvatum]